MTIESSKQDLDAEYEGPLGTFYVTGPTYGVQRGDKIVEYRWSDHQPTGVEKPYTPPAWFKDRFK